MFKFLKSLLSEFFGIYSSIFDDNASDDASDEVKHFISLVVQKNYADAAIYLIASVKEAKDLEIDDIALQADRVGLDLKEVTKVINEIRASFTPAAHTTYDPEHKAVTILEGALTYAHS